VRGYHIAMAKQSRREVAEEVLEITLLVTRLVTPEVRRLRPKQLSLSHMRAWGSGRPGSLGAQSSPR